MFRRLAVFAGGSTLEAAEAVCDVDDDLAPEALDVIASLLDASMVTTAAGQDGAVRIGMLDTIRAYAAERLAESGEAEVVGQEHATYYCILAEEACPRLVGAEEPAWAARLLAERDNLRLALEWSLHHDVELGLRLGSSLFRFWEAHSMIVEGHGWLTALLALPSPPSHARGTALHAAAALGCYLGEYEVARGRVREALEIFERLDDKRRIAVALNELGVLAAYEGDFTEATRQLEGSLEIKRDLGDDRLIANAFVNLGLVAGWQGDHLASYDLHAQSLALFEGLQERMGIAIAMHNLADAAGHLGRLGEAYERQAASLRLFDDIGDADGCAECLEGLAILANAREDSRSAALLFGLAAVLRENAGTQPAAPQLAEVERELAFARSRLGEAAFDAAWQAGREMSVEEAIALACAPAPTEDAPASRPP